MQTVRVGSARGLPAAAAVGLAAQLALLAVLGWTVGLAAPGWVIGAAVGLTTNVALARALHRAGSRTLGPANLVTLGRATLVGGVAALVADSFSGPAPVPAMVALTTVALLLDAVDGWTARRTGTVSAVGARFDMEVDSFLVLVLALYDVRLLGGWVLAIGAARYLFVAAGWLLPWLRAPGTPPRYWNKVVAVVQGVVLTVAMADILPTWLITAAAVVALGLLAESFGRQVWWLWRHRAESLSQTAASTAGDEAAVTRRPSARRVAAVVTTVLAGLLVWFALVAPNDSSRLVPGAFVRIPIEALVLAALFLLLPARSGRVVVMVAGGLLGLLTIIKILDMGFLASLNRPFNPLSDWTYIGPAIRVLGASIGQLGAVASVAAAGTLIIGLVVLVPLAVRRLSRVAMRDRVTTSRFVAAFAVLWLVSAVVGLQLAPGAPVASASVARQAYDEVSAISDGIRDQQAFEAAMAVDPIVAAPPADLLSALHGKNVVIAFVESYGRVAVQDSPVAAGVDSVLDAGTRRLAAAGFASQSAFLTSPTFGGISWLAHSTLQSGLWVNSQRRYDQLMGSDRLTLSNAFRRAGWRTVVDSPANEENWAAAQSFYGYQQIYDSRNVGYQGPAFGFAAIPDQYTLSYFQRAELADPSGPPVMAELDLLTSHTPWAPLPTQVDWDRIGDGTVYSGMPELAPSVDEVWDDSGQIVDAYGRSIEYSLNSLISFVETYGDDDLVLLIVGDHQPATIVTGPDAGHDVPITLVARDPAVMQRVSSWGWQNGMNPDPAAPVWPMDSFRDRFLDAFSG